MVERHQALALAATFSELNVGCRSTVSRCDLCELADEHVRIVDARLGLGRTRFRAAPQPFDLRANSILQGFLATLLRFEKRLFVFQEAAVIAARAQNTSGI